jgi:hypothetical protein
VAPSCVDLIHGASRAFVLSDVGTDAAGRTGELCLILEGWATDDRDPPRAMRPWLGCLERTSFSLQFMTGAAKLFTVDCGELTEALLAAG